MGIRQTLNENPALTTGVTIGIIVIAIGIIIWEATGGSGSSSSVGNASLKFFSDDDGKSYFADDRTNLPPYKDKRGKIAVGAVVFKCADGKPFVTRLERYTPEGQKKIKEQLATNPNSRVSIAFTIGYTEYKKPGPGNQWAKIGSPSADIQPHCPNGSDNDLQIVEPSDKDRLP